jgi:hypothetical protein
VTETMNRSSRALSEQFWEQVMAREARFSGDRLSRGGSRFRDIGRFERPHHLSPLVVEFISPQFLVVGVLATDLGSVDS